MHFRAPPEHLNGQMDFICIWYLTISVTGHCTVNMNIKAPKIGATEMAPTKNQNFLKNGYNDDDKFQQFMKPISSYKIA
jgi:hypothetical protein